MKLIISFSVYLYIFIYLSYTLFDKMNISKSINRINSNNFCSKFLIICIFDTWYPSFINNAHVYIRYHYSNTYKSKVKASRKLNFLRVVRKLRLNFQTFKSVFQRLQTLHLTTFIYSSFPNTSLSTYVQVHWDKTKRLRHVNIFEKSFNSNVGLKFVLWCLEWHK